MKAWLDRQFAAKQSSHPALPALPAMPASSSTGCPAGSPPTCVRDNYTLYPLQVRFFRNALEKDDQLRQRVALALHEILVVSGLKVTQPSQMAPYLNMLLDNAFENYRKILYDLTLNPAMGRYLDMVNNDARRRRRTSRRTKTTPARSFSSSRSAWTSSIRTGRRGST